MNYYGPRHFKPILSHYYETVRVHLNRTDVPLIIVGSIKQVAQQNGLLLARDNPEDTSTLEECLEKWIRKDSSSRQNDEYRTLRETSRRCTHLPPNAQGEYNCNQDALIFSPENLVNYVAARLLNQKERKNEEPQERAATIMATAFPNLFFHEMAHWDLGRADYYQDLRKIFQAYYTQAEYKRDASELENHISLKNRLNISIYGETAVRIFARQLYPLDVPTLQPDCSRAEYTSLNNLSKKGSPQYFLARVCDKLNEAYHRKMAVTELLS